MNANQVINMVVRMVVNRLLRKGINSGMDMVGNRMARNKDASGEQPQAAAPDSKDTTKRMRQTMRMTRRMGRF